MFFSAFVAIKPTASQEFLLDRAVVWARQYGWRLRAGTVIDANRIAPVEPVPLGAGAFKHERDELLMQKTQTAADAIVKQTEAFFHKQQITGMAQVFAGDTVDVLCREVQENDLLLVGHHGGSDTGDESLLFRILKHSARPAIVVPRQGTTGENIMVAYDGSFQSARTLAAFACSGLGLNLPVHVVTCGTDAAAAEDHAQRACRFLQSHQISATAQVETGSASTAEHLLQCAMQLKSGLLVMGAFGKSAMRDFFLGSVTRSILHRLPLPVFLYH